MNTTVHIHKMHGDEVGEYCDTIISRINDNQYIMYLFGLQFGLAMEKVTANIYQSQYGERFIIVTD